MGGRGSTSPAAPKGTRRMTTVVDATGRPLFMREETREEMMRRVIKAQIAAAERPETSRLYDLGPLRMTVNPIGDGRYSVDVNEVAANFGGTSRTARGRSLLTRKSVTWDKLLELAQASVDKAGNI